LRFLGRSGAEVTVWLSGGTDGEVSTFRVAWETTAGRIDDDVMIDRLPGTSIEFSTMGYVNGKQIGQHINAVALDGKNPVAFPKLMKFAAEYTTGEYMPEKEAFIKAFMQKVMEKLPVIVGEIVDQLIGDAPGDAEKEKLQKEVMALKEEKAETEFAALVASKAIDEGKKTFFMELYKDKGLIFAKDALASKTMTIPTNEMVPTGTASEASKNPFPHLASILKYGKDKK